MGSLPGEEPQTEMPHVVALAFLTQGHITPLMNFCLKLADHNIQVTFVTVNAPDLIASGEAPKQAPKIPHGYSGKIHLQQLTLDLPPQIDPLTPQGIIAAFKAINALERPFEELVLGLSPNVRCIISDCLYSWTQSVAQRVGIPRAGFWTAAAASLAVDFFVPLLLQNGDIPVTDSNRNNVITYVPGLAPLRASQLPFIYHRENSMTTSDPGYKRKSQRSLILRDDAWIIVNSPEDLEPETFNELRRHLNPNIIGVLPFEVQQDTQGRSEGVVSSAQNIASWWKQDFDCLKWLDSKSPRSVVYISFGSAIQLTVDQFTDLSRGIELSQQPFVWSLRPGGVENLPEKSLESFKERTKSQGVVISWAPQREVLAHGSTGAFVTHCGWNSMLEGICSGVPVLGWPMNAEQNLNCKLVAEDMGIGCSLMEEERYGATNVGAEEIAARIRKSTGDSEIQKRAGFVKARATRTRSMQPLVDYIRHSA